MEFLSFFAQTLAELLLLVLALLFVVKFERIQFFELMLCVFFALLLKFQSFFVEVIWRDSMLLLGQS